jgi:thiamine pyrophosphokinase
MQNKKALIVGNGERPAKKLFDFFMQDKPLLLCADGGANTAVEYGYGPDFIVGDFDSVRAENKAGVPSARLILVDEDSTGTDMQKVLNHALDLGIEAAVLLGFTGGRIDHVLHNLSLLKTFENELGLRLVDDYCDIRLIGRRIRFRAPLGLKLSLCPLTGPVEGIETTGLRFPLNGEQLMPGIRDGISNEVVAGLVEIKVGEGDLLLCLHREHGVETDSVVMLDF